MITGKRTWVVAHWTQRLLGSSLHGSRFRGVWTRNSQPAQKRISCGVQLPSRSLTVLCSTGWLDVYSLQIEKLLAQIWFIIVTTAPRTISENTKALPFRTLRQGIYNIFQLQSGLYEIINAQRKNEAEATRTPAGWETWHCKIIQQIHSNGTSFITLNQSLEQPSDQVEIIKHASKRWNQLNRRRVEC
jgi:hypothetical protein